MVYVVKRVASKLRRIDCINYIMKSRKKNSEVVSPDISSVAEWLDLAREEEYNYCTGEIL